MKKQLLLLITLLPFIVIGQITQVEDINPSGDSSPSELFVDSSNTLFFQANNGTDGKELYVYDGTNTTLIDINTFETGDNSTPTRFIEFNGKIYFKASEESTKSELYVTDGTAANTSLVADLNPGSGSSNPDHFFVLNNELYFTVLDGSSTQIWALNGGTPIKITANNGGSFSSASYPHVTSTGAFIRLNNGNGNELGFFDGTGDAIEILDIRSGNSAGLLVSTDRKNIELLGDKLFFEADPNGSDDELWVSDGTSAGTFQVADTNISGNGDPDYLEAHQGVMYFASEDENGYQLWKSDGTVSGTVLVSDTNPGGNGDVKNLFSDGTALYFSATNGTDGTELWKYDGTSSTMIKDINTSGDSSPSNFTILGGTIYFSANDGSGAKLWMTNGTSAGTVAVASLFPSSIDPIDVDDILVRDNELIFSGDNGTTGNELYSFDPATLSINSVNTEVINVYPNPATEYIMVPQSLIKATYSIVDVTGKKVTEGVISSEKIELNLNSGMYLFNVKTDLSSITKKIMVK